MSAINSISNPYLRGKENYRACFNISDNPYTHGTDEFNEWIRGFINEQGLTE